MDKKAWSPYTFAMQRYFRNVTGSLNALVVLESAVRHSSFTKAGEELGLSQPTVSRHVATLEARIGQPLFQRKNNRIRATQAGQRLAQAVSLGLGHAESAWKELSQSSKQDDMVLACSFGFANNWLQPNFRQLKQVLAGKRLRITTSDWMESLDMERVDLAVVWDLSYTPDRPYIPLLADEAFPVCSPEYLQRHPEIVSDTSALLDANLLHFDVAHTGFMTWKLWFAHFGINIPLHADADMYDAYPFLLKAAQDGEGVVLGWRGLVDRMIEDGMLVQVGPSVVNKDTAYYLQYRTDSPRAESIAQVVQWFKQSFDSEKTDQIQTKGR